MKPAPPKRVPCPQCRSPRTQKLPHASAASGNAHYRCESCGNIWTEPKTPRNAKLAA